MISSIVLRKKIKKVIATYPSIIDVKRADKVSDGAGGWIKDIDDTFATFTIFMDTTGVFKSYFQTYLDGGLNSPTRDLTMYSVANDNSIIRIGDYFTFENIKYKVISTQTIFESLVISTVEGDYN